MNNLVRFVGSVVTALILICIPGLLVASFAFGWHSYLKALLCMAAIVECGIFINFIDERSEE